MALKQRHISKNKSRACIEDVMNELTSTQKILAYIWIEWESVEDPIYEASTVNVWIPHNRNPNYARIRMEGDLEFRQFRFQTFGLLELHSNCLKSKLVQISDIHCTVDVRKQNVRFAKPNEKVFGYQTFGYRTFGLFGLRNFSQV